MGNTMASFKRFSSPFANIPSGNPLTDPPVSPHTCDRGAPLVVAGIGSPALPRAASPGYAGSRGRVQSGWGREKSRGPPNPGLRSRSGGRAWPGSGTTAFARAQSIPALLLSLGLRARDPQSPGAPRFQSPTSHLWSPVPSVPQAPPLGDPTFCASTPWRLCPEGPTSLVTPIL